jgi:superfamily II DNA or RNA helicase
MLLKNYQDEAVRELLSAILRYLVKTGSKSLVLKAPTGSGKTVIMQEFLRRLADIPTP